LQRRPWSRPEASPGKSEAWPGTAISVSNLRGAWERAVARSERDGHGPTSAAVALILLALCGIGFAGVAVAVFVSGAENRSDLGAAAGGVIGALVCVVLALRLTSDPGEEDGTLSFMTAKWWRALQVVAGASLVTLGLVEVSDGSPDGWKMVVLAVVVVGATQGLMAFARRTGARS
jgi:hypothetical protein